MSGLHLVHSESVREGKSFRTGQTITDSGIYQVIHPKHRLPEQVTLVKGQVFPTCSRCSDAVEFRLLCASPSPGDFNVVLYALPEMLDEAERKAAAS